MALRFGKATKTTPESWLSMQAKLDLWRAAGKPAQVGVFEVVEGSVAQEAKKGGRRQAVTDGLATVAGVV